MNFEKINKIETEKEPNIKLIGSSYAPEKFKENPFYNVYHWGMADWEEKSCIYQIIPMRQYLFQ